MGRDESQLEIGIGRCRNAMCIEPFDAIIPFSAQALSKRQDRFELFATNASVGIRLFATDEAMRITPHITNQSPE